MKKMLIFVPLLALLFFSCTYFETIVGSGNLVEMRMGFSGFSKLDVDAPFDVTVIQDDDYSVTIMVDENIVDRVDITQSGSFLVSRCSINLPG